jgi:hypothetical protein
VKRALLPRLDPAGKRALLACLLLSACGQAKTEVRPGPSAEPPASAAPPVTATASASAAPRDLRPPGSAASRAEREKAVLELLAGRSGAAELPLADVDPGEAFAPALRFAMSMPMNLRIGAITARDLDEKEVLAAVEPRRGRLRVCYAVGLRDNPNLMGRVAARLLATAAGQPARVEDAGSDMPDSRVIRCVLEEMTKVELPAPRAAEGSAVVPVMFQPY